MKRTNKEFLLSTLYSLVMPAVFYFALKLFQSNYHIISSSIDSKIPFIPYFIYIYILFFPFIVAVFYLVFTKDKEKYYRGITASTLGLIITEIIFLIYPTIIYRPEITSNIDNITKAFINITYSFDTPSINCFPSIHCLLCFQASYMILSSNNIKSTHKTIVIISSIIIIISTVLVKQHYFYDIIGSFIIFCLSNILVYAKSKKYHKIQ